jgi:ribosomal protein L37AE/L43A
MGIAAIVVILVVAFVVLLNRQISRYACPFCGGTIRRAFEKMECEQCGRLFYMWQAKRR